MESFFRLLQKNYPKEFDRMHAIIQRHRGHINLMKNVYARDQMILDATKDTQFPELTEEQLEQINAFWGKYSFAYKNNPEVQRVYSGLSGRFDPKYMGDGIQWHLLRGFNFDHAEHIAFPDKNYVDLLFPDVQYPTVVARRVRSCYMNAARERISEEAFVDLCYERLSRGGGEPSRLIVKPRLGGGGTGISFFTEGQSKEEMLANINCYDANDDLIVEEYLTEHETLARPHPSSVNTLRIVTLCWKERITVIARAFRVGAGSAVIDNLSSGGMACGVEPDGTCHDFFVDKHGNRLKTHPDGFVIAGHKLEGVEKVLETAIKLHERVPCFRYISWDFAVDTKGEPILIELNPGGYTDIVQATGFLGYGEYTEEILDELLLKQFYIERSSWKYGYHEYHDHVEIVWYAWDDEEIQIPAMLNKKPVTAIHPHSFHSKNLKKVTIPKQVTVIQNKAFSSCTNLKEVYYEGNIANLNNCDEIVVSPIG